MLTVTRQGLVASAAVTADRPRSHPGRPPSYDKKVGLVLQGGGGAWQLSGRSLRGFGIL
jgi:hypothetical protein